MKSLLIMDFEVHDPEEITRALVTMELYKVSHTPGKTNRKVYIEIFGEDLVHEYDNAIEYDLWNFKFIDNDSLKEYIKQILYGV